MRFLLAPLLLTGCVPEHPASLDDCRFALGGGARKDCVAEVALHLFKTDAAAAPAFVEANIVDSVEVDVLYYRVTDEVPNVGDRYCKNITDPTIRSQCDTRAKRPHLNGAGSPASGPPGGPPGGAGSGPPPGAPPAGGPRPPG